MMRRLKTPFSKLEPATMIVQSLFILLISGCMSTITFTKEELVKENDHDIVVFTHDGKKIVFQEGDYKIVNGDSSPCIQGKGRLFPRKSSRKYIDWDSTISFKDIESIVDYELNIVGYAFLTGVAIIIISVIGYAAGGGIRVH
jgi:hypothetical protein